MKLELRQLKDGRWYWRAMFGNRAAANVNGTRLDAAAELASALRWVAGGTP